MAKSADSTVLDGSLEIIRGLTTPRVVLCNAEPTDFNDATVTKGLTLYDASAAVTFSTISSSGSDRVFTVNSPAAALDVDHSDTGTHVALVDNTGSTLRFVTTCANVSVDAAGTVTIGSWTITATQPT